MKRSELLNKLMPPISWLGGGLYTEEELYSISNELLQICEDAGMTPPQYKKWFLDPNDDEYGGVYRHVREWEPEDEK